MNSDSQNPTAVTALIMFINLVDSDNEPCPLRQRPTAGKSIESTDTLCCKSKKRARKKDINDTVDLTVCYNIATKNGECESGKAFDGPFARSLNQALISKFEIRRRFCPSN